MGGRSETLGTPFFEILGHMITKFEEQEREAEKESIDFYMNFVAMLNSNPQNEKQQKVTNKFMKEIKPRLDKQKKSDNPKNKSEDLKNKYKWPDRVQKKVEAMQQAEQQNKQ